MTDKIKREMLLKVDIPPLPEAALRVQALADDPNTTARDLASVISSDPTLTAQLLKQANSSFYGFPKAIGTVPLAVVVLGFDAVRETALAVSVLSLASSTFEQSLFQAERFWSHSLAVGVGARLLAQTWHGSLPGEAFVVGLMHDLGRLLLAAVWPEQYKRVIREVNFADEPMHVVEHRLLGTDHAEVAYWLIERWNLPDRLAMAVGQHHHDFKDVSDDLHRMVILADWLAHRSGFRHVENTPYPPEPEGLAEILPGFDELKMREEIHELYRKARSLLDLIGGRVQGFD